MKMEWIEMSSFSSSTGKHNHLVNINYSLSKYDKSALSLSKMHVEH